jgi:hypothetical protein
LAVTAGAAAIAKGRSGAAAGRSGQGKQGGGEGTGQEVIDSQLWPFSGGQRG